MSHSAMIANPPTMHAAPTTLGSSSPRRMFFSMKNTAANTAIQAMFVSPSTARTAISAQQQPRQKKPCEAPPRTADAGPLPNAWLSAKPIGERPGQRCDLLHDSLVKVLRSQREPGAARTDEDAQAQ